MAQAQQLTKKDAGLIKGLGLLDATTLVMGSMIGSGIFIVAADIARQVQSPGLLLMTWIVTAVLTIIAALSYGELAAAMPQAGGQYVYLREAFGPLWGFLYGWTLFLVIQTGTVAAVAVPSRSTPASSSRAISADNWILPFSTRSNCSRSPILVVLYVGEYPGTQNRVHCAERLHFRQDGGASRSHRFRAPGRAQ